MLDKREVCIAFEFTKKVSYFLESRALSVFNMCIYDSLASLFYRLGRNCRERSEESGKAEREAPPLRFAIVTSGENDPCTRDLLCDTSHIRTYLGSESIVGRAPLARATASWLLELPRSPGTIPAFPPSRSSFLSVSPSAGFYGDGYGIRVYMFTVHLRMLCAWAHTEKYVCARGDHARESGTADKLMASPERPRLPMGNPARPSRSPRSPYADISRRWPGEKSRAGTEFLPDRPIARAESSCPGAATSFVCAPIPWSFSNRRSLEIVFFSSVFLSIKS